MMPGTLMTPLTPREVDVALILATGVTNSEIGAQLSIGEGTVKTHVRNILDKLGVANRVEAALWAALHLPAHPNPSSLPIAITEGTGLVEDILWRRYVEIVLEQTM